ncbi:hypothetical protein [Microvirga yunnanensis]|uniref:hypothetical protein n=1 Tax=Microvirga yunnanensis TaxID=2953740 RepID=UPI0021C5F414|nr:hypothetical protein [Microvirga sp. HBU67655]
MTSAWITFRGEEHEVEYTDSGYEPDTGAHVIEWGFKGLSPDEHEALAITNDEDQEICEALAARGYDEEPWYD